MKYAQLSLPRSRSEALFWSLAPMAEEIGMNVHYPTRGDYYYIENDDIDPNRFCKIDTRTPLDRFERIVKECNDHTWFVSTREFEDFCMSLAYSLKREKFHDMDYSHQYTEFEVSYPIYKYAVEIYSQFQKMLEMISDKKIEIREYDSIVNHDSPTVHIEKDYKSLCTNYQQLRDWQRIDYIQSQEHVRKWNCITSFDTRNLQEHPLFADIAGPDVQMWYNIYEKGDSQDWHKHEGVKSCGTRFLQTPIGSGMMQFRDLQVHEKAGSEIAFGPDDEHRVTENRSEQLRITVSWNVI